MTPDNNFNLDLIPDQRGKALIESITDPIQKETIYCSISTYQHEDQLFVGDSVPAMPLVNLNTKQVVDLEGKRDKPLVLFFGSYT